MVLKGSDSFLKCRVKEILNEEQMNQTHYNELDMERRLKAWHSTNSEAKGSKTVEDFFKERHTEVFEINCGQS